MATVFDAITNSPVGELRVDEATGITYRWDGTAWIVNGTGTPSSADLPDGAYLNEVREDIKTGRLYRWDGTVWNLLVGSNDTDQDGLPDIAETVSDGGITTAKLADDAVTAAKLATNAVGKDALNYEVKTVSIAAATSGTDTVTAGSQIVWFYVTAITWTERVKTVDIADTTLTVTLTGADTATVNVVVIPA